MAAPERAVLPLDLGHRRRVNATQGHLRPLEVRLWSAWLPDRGSEGRRLIDLGQSRLQSLGERQGCLQSKRIVRLHRNRVFTIVGED